MDSIEFKVDRIKEILKINEFEYIDNYLNDDQIHIVYNLFCKKIIQTSSLDNDICGKIMLYIGVYYIIKDDVNRAKRWYIMSIEKKNTYAIRNYANLMKKEDNIEEAKKYYLMLIRIGDADAMCSYANLISEENPDNSKIFYMMAIEKEKSKYTNIYAFDIKHKNPEEAKKYFLIAINMDNLSAMCNYANLISDENPEEAKHWYMTAIEKGHVFAMCNYANLISDENPEEAKHWCIKAIKKECKTAIKIYINYCKNELEAYVGLIDILDNNPKLKYIIEPELNKIKSNDKSHVSYFNKIKLNSKIDQCGICLEENSKLILLECDGHYACTKCYIQLLGSDCPYRCDRVNIESDDS